MIGQADSQYPTVEKPVSTSELRLVESVRKPARYAPPRSPIPQTDRLFPTTTVPSPERPLVPTRVPPAPIA